MSFNSSCHEYMKQASIIAILFVCFLLQACKNKTENTPIVNGETVFETSQPSFVKIIKSGETFYYEKSETRFDIIELFGKEPQKLLFSITQNEKRELAQDENTRKQFSVSVKSVGSEKVDWTKEIEGANLDYSTKVLNVQYPAGENEDDTYTFYNIRNGEKIIDFTYGELKVMIPNTSDRRFFAYLSKNNSLKTEVKGDGVISYASSEKLLQQFSIKSKGKVTIPSYTPDIQVLAMRESGNQLTPDGRTIVLMKLNENYTTEDVTGFAFQVRYFSKDGQTEYKLIFPIENDKIDLKNVIYDKSLFEVREI